MNELTIRWWRTDFGEREIAKIREAIINRHINAGPVCVELEERLAQILGVPYVILTTSGSSALLLALLACGVSSGDEVIIPALTFIATANAVMFLKAKPKLVDVKKSRHLIDVQMIEQAITKKTKAIIPVHLNGMACDMEEIMRIANRYGIKVIEDAAQAFYSRDNDRFLGTIGHFGVFSMSISKIISTAEGGFLAIKERKEYEKALKFRNHGVLSLKENIFREPGFNFRFNDILAAMGIAQLETLKEKVEAVKAVYRFYKSNLSDLSWIKMCEVYVENGELPLWAEALCSERDQVIKILAKEGIEAKPFPPNLDQCRFLKAKGDFPNANFFARNGLILPCGPHQPLDNLQKTVEVLKKMKIQSNIFEC